ncbi:MAG TPA: LPS export ABC transporter periplasmic protein LptC [Allosphingosinicella sp.]
MSEAALKERVRKQGWAAPGGLHDFLVRLLKIVLPTAIGVLLAYLALAPLQKGRDISFILDKNKVDVAKERMRVESARYRGQDNKGRPFTVDASSAVQANSQQKIVDILGMSAEIGLDSGPATLRAGRGRYDIEAQKVDILGPIQLAAADGYRLVTRDVAVDLGSQQLESRGAVQGTMPLGRFSANKLQADLPQKKVVLTGRARLHIKQGAIR